MEDFDDVYKKHAELVYKYIMSMCHNHDLAEEVTQETFYRAVKSIKKYDGSCKMSTWLCSIAKHVLYKEFDRRKKEDVSSYINDVDNTNPDAKFLEKERQIELMKAIHKLDETSREIVLLRLSGEVKFKDIGEIFDKSENWARVTFYRAKEKLRRYLND